MIGRGGGIFLAKILTPTIYAAIDLVVCVIALALLAIPQIMGAPLLYTATAIFGLAMSSVYANGLNFVAKRINCSGRDKSFSLMRPGGSRHIQNPNMSRRFKVDVTLKYQWYYTTRNFNL